MNRNGIITYQIQMCAAFRISNIACPQNCPQDDKVLWFKDFQNMAITSEVSSFWAIISVGRENLFKSVRLA